MLSRMDLTAVSPQLTMFPVCPMKDDATPATKGDLSKLEQRLEKKMDAQKEEIMRHFDAVAENLFHDLAGAHRDEIAVLEDRKDDHERRIRRLERATGTVAA